MIPFLLLAIQTAAPPQLVVLDTPVGAREPQVAMHVRLPPEGSQGRAAVLHGCIHVAFGTPNAIYVSTSTDDAKTFEHPVRIAEVGRLALGMRRGPRIAVSDDWVVVTAIAGEEGGGRDGDLLCWRFRDDRTGVGPAVRLNPKPGAAREGLHAMASGPDDELCCVWIDLDGDSPRICCAVSRNSGETWGPPVVVQQDGGAICACCAPSVAIDGHGTIAVMWRGQDRGGRDMYLARSEDGGVTFSKPAKLGKGTWKIDACPMDGGAIASRSGETVAVWRREQSVYRVRVDGTEELLGEGEQPWITGGPWGWNTVWLRKRRGPLLYMSGWTEPPLELDSTANDPAIVSRNFLGNPVVAVWESGAGDHPKIVAARIDRWRAAK